MDSVLADFYGPLWKEYHIFGYYAGVGSDAKKEDKLAETITEYMSYTLNPCKGTDGLFTDAGIDLLGISTDRAAAGNLTDLTEYDGELIVNEAVEYMKYREAANGIELLLNHFSLLETPGKVSYIMEEKQKAEEELIEVDMEILNLMELYDGLVTTEKGIETSEDGTLITTSSFIKKICYEEITMNSVGINQEGIFQRQKEYYINPSGYFSAMNNDFTVIDQINAQIEEYRTEIAEANKELSEKVLEQEKLKSKEKKTKSDKKQLNQIKKDIKTLNSNIAEKESKIRDELIFLNSKVLSIKNAGTSIADLMNQITPLISAAITSVDKLINKMKTAAPVIKQYEELLTSQKDSLSEDIYSSLFEELKELKKYSAADQSGYDFPEMKTILLSNQAILSETFNAINQAEEELTGGNYSGARLAYGNAETMLQGYRIHGLTLDYSTLVLDKAKRKAPLEKVSGFIQNGLTGLVLNPESISDFKLPKSDVLLPSEVHALTDDRTDYGSILTAFFKNSLMDNKNTTGELFRTFTNNNSIEDTAAAGLEALAERLLYQEYLKEHFYFYQPADQNSVSQKPSALLYEQEYLLSGKTTDMENLNSMIARLIFMRMTFDFVSVISNSSIRNEAKLAAAALVGFTGLPILVSLTQLLILLLWSFSEALLDTCALLMGKEMPVLKKNIILTFPEIFLLNRSFLQEKASALSDTKEFSLSYRDYLRIFLLMKDKEDLAYRSMDLIQENIKLRYAVNTFALKDCLFGFEASAGFAVESKFTGFTFLHKYFSGKLKSFQFIETAACSY